MAIKKANELDLTKYNVSILLDGRPGVGKTTLALSAENPLLIDIEDGVSRVEACYRRDTMQADRDLPDEEKYNSLINDLTHEDLSSYDTLICDSIGKFMEIVTPVVIKENPVNAQKDGKTLSLKGYGAIATKFKEFNKLVKSLKKDIIWIAHCTEIQDGDLVKTRIMIPGSTKDSIWDDIDLGGFIEFQGKQRVIHFTPTQSYDAKGSNGVNGTYDIPLLKDTKQGGKLEDNHFIKDLITAFKNDKIQAQKQYSEGSEQYNEAMKLLPEIKAISNVDQLNEMITKLSNVKHALTSEKELKSHFKDKVKELGATYDKEAGKYTIVAKD